MQSIERQQNLSKARNNFHILHQATKQNRKQKNNIASKNPLQITISNELSHQESFNTELDQKYELIAKQLQAIRLKSSEHTHGRWFLTKHKTFQTLQKQEYRNQVTEVCPCCIGVLDLDEAASLGKLSSLQDKHSATREINALPSGPLDWFSSALGGYFALAGLYFGIVNFKGSLDRNIKLKRISTKNTANLQTVLQDSKSTNEEVKNLQAYQASIAYSKLDGQYQKWGDGAMPATGSAMMLGSLIYAPLTAPALSVMTGYALGHAIKSGLDLRRHVKADTSQLDNIDDPMSKKGKETFLTRFRQKKGFYKKVIASYLSYAAGTAILGATAIAGLASFAFPPALIAIGATFLLIGVFSTVYFNNRWGKTYAPKNENHIHRQMIGDTESILRSLFLLKKQKGIVKRFKRSLQEHLRECKPYAMRKSKMHTTLYYILTALTLGVPHRIRGMKKKIKERFTEELQSEVVKRFSRDKRQAYFKDMLQSQIEYFQHIKLKLFQMDLSVMKPFIVNSHEIPLQQFRNSFLEIINQQLRDRKDMFLRFRDDYSLHNQTYDFINTWDYLCQHGLIGSVLEKLYDSMETKKIWNAFQFAGFLEVKESLAEGHSHNHHHSHDTHKESGDEKNCEDSCGGNHAEGEVVREYNIHLHKVIEAIRLNHPQASEFLKHWYSAVDYTLLHTLDEELEYQIHEICNHLEDRLRLEKKNCTIH